jgi:hypothetical protein
MRQTVFDNFFWASGQIGEVALTAVLILKGRWRKFPAFTAMIAVPSLATFLLFPLEHWRLTKLYADVYRVFSIVDFLVQIALVFELARVVLRPTGTWVRDARRQFILSGVAGVLLAVMLAYMVAPPSPDRAEGLEIRANLFTSLLICELVITVSMASNRLGLGWKNHVMAIGQGFTAWAIVATIVDSLHSYFGTEHLYESAEYVKFTAYLCALAYWGVQLWREEPARQPISPELRKFIIALHERVQYDLGEAER